MKNVGERNVGAQKLDAGYLRRASLTNEVLFHGKWKLQILYAMRSGPIRLGQLARIVPGASKKMLTQNLRKLEADGIVVRKDLTEVILHIEYDLDDRTRESVCTLLDHLARWGGCLPWNRLTVKKEGERLGLAGSPMHLSKVRVSKNTHTYVVQSDSASFVAPISSACRCSALNHANLTTTYARSLVPVFPSDSGQVARLVTRQTGQVRDFGRRRVPIGRKSSIEK